MSNRGEVWVHGNSVVLQYPGGEGVSRFTPGHRMIYGPDPDSDNPNDVVPWSDLLGVRSIKGATFRGAFGDHSGLFSRSTNHFHFSVPTPAIFPVPGVADHRFITVDKISVYYKTAENISITGISVTGGGHTQGISLSPEGISGTHNVEEDADNAWMLPSPITMVLRRNNSVLISVMVDFRMTGDITFTAAAIHYSVP